IVNVSYPKGTINPSIDFKNRSENAAIHYTLDGSEPTTSSPLFTQPVVVDHPATLKARAFISGRLPSAVQVADLKTYSWNKAKSGKKSKPGLKYSAYEAKFTTVSTLADSTVAKSGIAQSVDLKYTTRKEYTGLRFDGY